MDDHIFSKMLENDEIVQVFHEIAPQILPKKPPPIPLGGIGLESGGDRADGYLA